MLEEGNIKVDISHIKVNVLGRGSLSVRFIFRHLLLRLDGSAASTSTCHGVLLGLSLLGDSQQVGLHCAELGQVEGGDLLRLLDLLLVHLDLELLLVGNGEHPVLMFNIRIAQRLIID